jgi:uncharacterized protein
MSTWLIDTGPLVALVVANDHRHAWAVEQLKRSPTSVLTCDAVISEALYLLKRERHDPDTLFALIEAGFLRSSFDLAAEHSAIRRLMRRYADLPTSFADACLVRMAELHPGSLIWTLDANFRVYRRNGRHSLSLVTLS